MKKFIFGVLMVCITVLGNNLSAMAQQSQATSCAASQIKEYVDDAYLALPQSQQGQQLLAWADNRIQAGVVSETKAKTALKIILEAGIRQGAGCEISERLTKNVAIAYDVLDLDGVDCKGSEFKSAARKQYDAAKKEAGFAQYEQQVQAQFQAYLTDPKGRDAFNSKWKSASFRKEVIISSLESGFRAQASCKDAFKPFNDILSKFSK